MPKEKASLDLEAVIKEKANAYKLEEETLRKAVREELTTLLAREIAKQLVGGRQAVRRLPKTPRGGGEQPDVNLLDLDRLSVETRRRLLLELKELEKENWPEGYVVSLSPELHAAITAELKGEGREGP